MKTYMKRSAGPHDKHLWKLVLSNVDVRTKLVITRVWDVISVGDR